MTGNLKKFIFITGGARSGKSAFALKLANAVKSHDRLYIATAEPLDDEMKKRIALHRAERGALWKTVEAPVDAVAAIGSAQAGGVAVIDCLTIWISNLMMKGLTDDEVMAQAERLVSACRASSSTVIAVSNEVGLSIVPENGLARRFRDLSGLISQKTAEACDEAYFIVAGMPLKLKGARGGIDYDA